MAARLSSSAPSAPAALALAMSLATLAAFPAHGQYSLGSGNRLDRNLQVGSDGRNLPRAVENFQVRNAIVTGDTPGGFEFRGTVGYTSPFAFRGVAGSDDLFRFRADSALSSVPAVLGSMSADRYSLASREGVLEFSRDTTPTRFPFNYETASGRREPIDLRVVIDQAKASGMTSRMLERSSEGTLVGGFFDAAGRPFAVMGSSVTGLRYEPIALGSATAMELGLYDRHRFFEDAGLTTLPGTPFPWLQPTPPPGEEPAEGESPDAPSSDRLGAAEGTDSLRADPGRIEGRLDFSTDGGADYDAIVQQLVERFRENPNVHIDAEPAIMARLRAELEALRVSLGDEPADAGAAPPAPGEGEPAAPTPPAGAAPSEDEDAGADQRLTIEQMAEVLRHGRTVDDLSPTQRTYVDQLIARGESLLAAGEFFLAEQTFDRVLRMTPGHPMATAGIVNAQLAAGLHLSAAVNLRRFFAESPEMIDTRYAARLLPAPERLEKAVSALRQRMDQYRVDAPNYGLMLAYIGFQTDNRALIEEGLEAIKGSEANDTLRRLLRNIWLAPK